MPLAGRQLGMKAALALCYARGFRNKTVVITAACVMSAESLRYTRAYHDNMNDAGTVVLSTDYGLFQINDKAHPTADVDQLYDPRYNVDTALAIYKSRQGFSAWAAYNSGRYLQFWDDAAKKYSMQAWRLLIPRWQGESS